ncbi:hypothetical protein MTO96_030922 [Rhipicephalus appendiculatus]
MPSSNWSRRESSVATKEQEEASSRKAATYSCMDSPGCWVRRQKRWRSTTTLLAEAKCRVNAATAWSNDDGAAANFLTPSFSVAVEPEGGGFGGVGWQCEENTLAFNSQTVEEESFASFGRKVRCSGRQKKGFTHAKILRPQNRWAALRGQKRWRWGEAGEAYDGASLQAR